MFGYNVLLTDLNESFNIQGKTSLHLTGALEST